jgi:carboxypeptidase Taq
MEAKYSQLKSILAEVADLLDASALLGWDQQTYMPPGSAEGRSQQLSTLATLAHLKFTSEEVGSLLEELQPYASQMPPDSDETRLIQVTQRNYQKRTRVPSEFVTEFTRATSMAHQTWVEARTEDKFAKFQPHLEQILELRRSYAGFFAPYDHIYDPLLDDYEPGLKTTDVISIFGKLRLQQVALVQAIAERPQVDASFLHQPFDEQKQWDFGVQVISSFGYDWQRGRQDKSAHPFTTSIGLQDVRITTRLKPDYLGTALFGTMHEAGHALYELGVDPTLMRTPLGGGASLAVHESQSRLWENLIGRSLPFWEYYYPKLQQVFPSQLVGVSLERFYQGINQVKPSLIRVEADEATYNLHIMLRLELEIALLEASLAVKDLPEAWNARMRDYLGIEPPNDADGVLQDVHWSGGMIGYFPTYALGNLISAQIWEVINTDLPDLPAQIRAGNFSSLLSWLREKIHRHGAKFEPQELVQRVTGSKINPDPYVRYLKDKYSEIYGL